MKTCFKLFFAALILLGCTSNLIEKASPTFGEAFFSNDLAIRPYSSIAYVEGNKVLINSSWEYLGKDSLVGIDREFPIFQQRDKINLPHLIKDPNHSVWYRKRVQLEPGVLWISADDGAQLWVNGKKIERSAAGDFYEVLESGDLELIIRSVNNAMSGGLKKVSWMSKSDFLQESFRINKSKDSLFQLRKIELIQSEELKLKLEGLNLKQRSELLADFPILLTDPVLIYDHENRAMLRWLSEKGGISKLEFPSGEIIAAFSEDGIFTVQESDFTNNKFFLSQENSDFGEFSLPIPLPSHNLKIAVWGDSQGGWNTFKQISGFIGEQGVHLSIGAGDLVNNGIEAHVYPRFLQMLSRMNTRQVLVPGNHDYDGFYDDLDPKMMNKHLFIPDSPTYGVHYFGSTAILTLDPNENFPVDIPESTGQGKFLEKALHSKAWENATWKIVVIHQPPFSQGWPGYQGEKNVLNVLQPYFHDGLVDLVIAGHTHDYERLTKYFSGNEITFLVVGGAGGGLEPIGMESDYPKMDLIIKKHYVGILEVDSTRFSWRVYGLDEQVLDSLIVKKDR